MSVPATQEIRKPLLEALRNEMPHSYSIGELFGIITRYTGEDPDEMSSSEKNILKEHIKQARSDLKQHGLISCPSKSTYMITNLGLEVLDEDPESIDDDYLARLRTRGTSVSPDLDTLELEPEPEPEPESEILDDTEGDLDFTGGEEKINTSYTPDEEANQANQVIEEEDGSKIYELEGVEFEDTEGTETEGTKSEGEDIAESAEFNEEPSYEPEPEPEPDYEDGNIASSSVKSLESVLEKFNEELANEVLRKTAEIPSDKFEMLVIDLLSKMGYRAFQNARYTTEMSGDDCIHGVIVENEPGLSPIYIQARKLSPIKKVGKGDIQAFVKAIEDKGGKGLFATTASFSAQAADYARSEGIMLVDGARLADLMIKNNFCVSVEKVFEIKSIDSESFGEYE